METIEQLMKEARKSKAEAKYYRTMWDLEHADNEELRARLRIAESELKDTQIEMRRMNADRTYQVA